MKTTMHPVHLEGETFIAITVDQKSIGNLELGSRILLDSLDHEMVLQDIWEDTIADLPKEYIEACGHTRHTSFRSELGARAGRSLPSDTLVWVLLMSRADAPLEKLPVDYPEYLEDDFNDEDDNQWDPTEDDE